VRVSWSLSLSIRSSKTEDVIEVATRIAELEAKNNRVQSENIGLLSENQTLKAKGHEWRTEYGA